jgi:hypothetical protein
MIKTIIKLSCFVCLTILLAGCFGWGGNNVDDFPSQQSNYIPVIMQRVNFENAVGTIPTQNIVNSGKIYIFENLLFITEVNDGFHVFNYIDPTNPIPLNYIKAPGATDLAIRNSLLYINQATDLLTLKYNYQTNSFDFITRNLNVFPQKISPDGFYTSLNTNEIVVNWIPN